MTLKAQSNLNEIQELVGAGIAIAVMLYLFYIFYTISNPLQKYFQNAVNAFIVGMAVAFGVVIIIVVAYFLLNRNYGRGYGRNGGYVR
jgi:Fe2+ transport system protein B